MRDILSKVMTASAIAGAALLVSACGGGGEANNMSDANALGTEVFNTEGTTDLNASTDMNGMSGNMGSTDMNASTNMGGTDMNASTNMSMNSTNSM